MSWLNGVFGLIGSLLTNHANSQSVDKTNAANAQIMRDQNAFNVDMWNRQNEYNLPINQMNRLKEAGINPALAYTNGVSGNSATSAPSSASAAPAIPKSYSNLITDMMETMLQGQQIKNMKAEENLNKANTEATYKSIEVSEHTIINIDADTKVKQEEFNKLSVEAEKAAQEVEKVRKEVELLGEQVDAQKFTNWFNKMTRNQQVKQKMLECDITEQQLKNMCAQLLNIQADTKLKGAQYDLATIEYKNGKLIFTINSNQKAGWRGEKWYDNTKSILELIGTVFSGGFSVSK